MTALICPVCEGRISDEYNPTKGEPAYCHQCELTIIPETSNSVDRYSSKYADFSQPKHNQRNTRNSYLPKCPLCGEKVKTHHKLRMRERVICPECEGELEVVNINPFKLGLPYNGHKNYKRKNFDW